MTETCLFYCIVGGIYTVLRSKALISTEELGNQYVLLGPYKEHCARTEVEDLEFPIDSPLHKAVTVMRENGHRVKNDYFLKLSTGKHVLLFPQLSVTFFSYSSTLELGWSMEIRRSYFST